MQSVIDDVVIHTNRPDLVAETQLAVSKATMKMHMTGPRDPATGLSGAAFYVQDIVSDIVILPLQTETRYEIDLSDYSQLRAVKGIQEWNVPLTGTEVTYEKLDENFLFDDYHIEKYDYFYRAGLVVNLRARKLLTKIKLSYYAFPIVDGATYTSWIASKFKDAIVEEAAATVFRMIGKTDEFKTYQAMTQDNISILQSFALEGAV